MANRKKYILLFLTLVLLAAATGYYLYNKPARDVINTDGKKTDAATLYATFLKDSSAAKKTFTSQVLEVSGMVKAISKNQQQQPVILLITNSDGASVNCTLEGPADNIKPGAPVCIKGICNGMGEGDADMGIMGDVYLVRCYSLKQGPILQPLNKISKKVL